MAGNLLDKCIIYTGGACMGGCIVALASAFPIAEIVLGAVYIDECPAAPAIPVYLMVCGIVTLLLMLVKIGLKFVCPTAQSNTVRILFTLVVALFALIWSIFGSYHIYSIYPPNYIKIDMDPNSLNSSISTTTAPYKTGFTSENQNQSTPNLNRTWMINNNNNNNQTLMNLIETLATGNISGQINLTETLTRVNISNNKERNLTETLARVNISNNKERNLTETLARVNISSEANREHLNAPQTRHVAAARPYCQRTLYLFAFWTTTLAYALTGHALVISVCILCFLKIAEVLTKYIV